MYYFIMYIKLCKCSEKIRTKFAIRKVPTQSKERLVDSNSNIKFGNLRFYLLYTKRIIMKNIFIEPYKTPNKR